jgi:hypothetical protein
MCELIRLFPGWEAIKVSRGHYRSCGKDPAACCVGAMIGAEPLILSSRDETYSPGKDTGRFWEAGASNVHWVICTSEQLQQGVEAAVRRVKSDGVFVEGTGLLKLLPVHYSIMAVGPSIREVKSSAFRVMNDVNAFFSMAPADVVKTELRDRLLKRGKLLRETRWYGLDEIGLLASEVRRAHAARSTPLSSP